MQALLDILRCPVSGSRLDWKGSADEGLLLSPEGAAYPIIEGIPRMLPADLLGPFLRRAYPDRLARWPRLAAAVEGAPPAAPLVLETAVAYDFQHVELADDEWPVDDWRATWARFQPGVPPSRFVEQAVVEIGCGEGRHAWLVGEHARLLVGLDLSRGVEVARRRDQRSHVFYVQADLHRPPLARGAFDALYSNGVLHHTPSPIDAFRAVSPLVRPGGWTHVWVYGLDEMRLSYRLSHLSWLRPVTNRLPRAAQYGLAAAGAGVLEGALWTPARLLRRVGRADLAERLPFNDAADRPWRYKVRRAMDRLNPPITHYLDRAALAGWFAEFESVEVVNAAGQGWSARGRVPPS